jgi:hypothetical protein
LSARIIGAVVSFAFLIWLCFFTDMTPLQSLLLAAFLTADTLGDWLSRNTFA